MKKLFTVTFFLLYADWLSAQELAADLNGYHFTTLQKLGVTPVENQNKSGTCWVYSANSFFESELLRMGKPPVDLSEMFVVRAGYLESAVEREDSDPGAAASRLR